MNRSEQIVIIDRIFFCFLILPLIFIGLTFGLIPVCVCVIIAVTARLIIQAAIKDKIGDVYTYLPLKLDRRSTDVIAMCSIISIGISYNEGELTGFILAVVVIGIAYLVLIAICFFKYDEQSYVQ